MLFLTLAKLSLLLSSILVPALDLLESLDETVMAGSFMTVTVFFSAFNRVKKGYTFIGFSLSFSFMFRGSGFSFGHGLR